MNARVAPLRAIGTPAARVALLGTGTVGSATRERLASWSGTPLEGRLTLVHVANSRCAISNRNGVSPGTRELLLHNEPRPSSLAAVADALAGAGTRIVIDATASDAVAERHAAWLAAGIHVVTACKLGQGAALARWRAIHAARARGGTDYGDSATVGAGLPVLRALRELQAGGDRIHALAGVLSGSLAWLCRGFDGSRPFSDCVREAHAAGYTEPDPRQDLCGEDVRRKLLILARAAGHPLEADAVRVESLLPPGLAALPANGLEAALAALDAPLRARLDAARAQGRQLHVVARLASCGAASVALEGLAADDPLRGGAGTDNRVAIWSDRYREQPLVIQGPGAGAQVTAAALLDDTLRIAATHAQRSR